MLKAYKSFISYLKYVALCVSYNVRSSISNKKSFIIQTLAMFINNFVFILFWAVLFDNKGGNINGTTLNDIIYLWSIPTIAYGICYFCFGGVDTLCKDIVDGNLDVYLTKPKHSLISQLTSTSILSAMGDLLSGLVCGIIAVGFNPLKLLLIIALGVIAAIALVSVITIINILSFWLGDMTNASKKYTNSLLITLTIYPESMFPKVIKVLMYTVIPAMYVAHIPVRIVKNFNILSVVLLLAVTTILVCTMFAFYKKGLKRYESGNGTTRR